MKRTIKKSLAIIITLAILLGMLPSGAFAQTMDTAVVASYAAPENISAQTGTVWEELHLPATLCVTLADDTTIDLPVTWTSAPAYDPDTAGEYILTAAFGEGYVLAEGLSAPTLTVTLTLADADESNEPEETDETDETEEPDEVDTLIAAIDALPVFDPEEVDVEDDDAYIQWLEEQYTVYESVPALYEQLEAFEQDEEAMLRIGEERAQKLTDIYGLFFANAPQLMAAYQAQWGTSFGNWVGNGTLVEALAYANSLGSGTAYIQLADNVNTTAQLVFLSGKTTVLDLNGYIIDRGLTTAIDYGNVLDVGGTLTLRDTRGGGYVTGGNNSGNGGCVYIGGSGTFNMESGKISGNNSALRGGGVFINGTFNMSGGEISGNTCNYQGGGGVYVNVGKVFRMSGGKIINNLIPTRTGGGIYIAGGGKFYMSNSAEISGNTAATGGGVFVSSNANATTTNQGVFEMRGGTVSGNTASGNGGGVYMQGGLLTLSTGTISGNSAGGNGGGIYFRNHTNGTNNEYFIPASFEIDGTVNITGNTKGASTPNNLYLGTVSVDESAHPNVLKVVGNFSGKVGITTQALPTLTTPVNVAVSTDSHTITAAEASCFVPDDNTNYYPWTDTADRNKVKFYAYNYVTYNGNGNTGGAAPTDSTKYSKDASTVTVKDQNTLYKTGYTFDSWNTANNGSGTRRAVNSKFTIGSNVTLYAYWRPNSYTVYYNGNIPSGASGTVTGVQTLARGCTYDIYYNLEAAPVLTGYTFGGWYSQPSCTTSSRVGSANQSVRNTVASGEVTLYAKWTANIYTVNYTANKPAGATGTVTGMPTAGQRCTYDVNYSLAAAPALTGYTFGGWYSQASCTPSSRVGSPYQTVRNTAAYGTVPLYAKWTANTYTVYYNGNKPLNASGAVTGVPTVGQSCTYDVNYNLAATPVLTGYTFGGWYSQPGCADASRVGAAGEAVRNTAASGSITLHAKWTVDTYTVTLDREGGVTGSQSFMATYDSSALAGYIAPTRPGRTFTGYYTGDNGTGALVIGTNGALCANVTGYTGANGIWIRTAATTLYAGWTLDDYSVTYTAGQHGSITGSATADYDTAYTDTLVPDLGYSRPAPTALSMTMGGASFTDYSYTQSSGAISIAENKITGNIVITGACVPNTYTVQYNGNKPWYASGAITGLPTVGQSCTYDVDYYLAAAPVLTGYTFGGWYLDEGCVDENLVGAAGGATRNTVTSGVVTLHGKWTANTYTVNYNANKPTGASGTVTGVPTTGKSCTYDENYNLAATPVLTGYTFGGWYLQADCVETSRVGAARQAVKNTATSGSITLHAKWTANTYTVNYSGNIPSGASGAVTGIPTAGQSCTYDVNYDLAATPVLTGYTFGGWYSQADCADASRVGAAGETVKNTATSGSITLHAKWTVNTYTVNYNANKPAGASGAVTGVPTAGKSCTYDVNYDLAATPVLTGYTFGGWYSQADCADASRVGDAGETVKNTAASGSITLHAKWTANTYTVNYSGNIPSGATGAVTGVPTAGQSCTYDVNYDLAATPVLTGYTFGGWYSQTDCAATSRVGAAGETVKNTATSGSITLHAKWTVDAYTVTLDREGGVTGAVSFTAVFDSSALAGYTEPTRPGRTFTGYYTGDNGTGALVIGTNGALCADVTGYTGANGIWIRTAATTLYAGWTLNDYSVTYTAGQHGGITGSATADYDTAYTDTLVPDLGYSCPAPTAVSMTMGGVPFTDYSYTQSSGAISIAGNKITGDIVITGACVPNTYTVNYNGNGATEGDTASSLHTYDAQLALTGNGFIRKYVVTYNYDGATGGRYKGSDTATYTFSGWNTLQDGTGDPYANSDIVMNLATSGTFELYAQWTGASVELPTPSRGWYTFKGWYADRACTEINRIGDGGASYTPTADILLYAKWMRNTYTISLTPLLVEFPARTRGYTAASAGQTVTVTNTGNAVISGFTVSCSSSAFNVAYASTPIVSGGEVSFTVQPAAGLSTGIHTATLSVETLEGTSQTMELMFQVYSAPVVTISGDTDIDRGQSTTLSANVSGGRAPYVYLWSTSDTTSDITAAPDASATYTVTVEDAMGARSSASVVVSVSEPSTPEPAESPAPTPGDTMLPVASDSPQVTPVGEADANTIAGIALTPAEDISDTQIEDELDRTGAQKQAYDYGSGQIIVIVPPYEGAIIAELPDKKAVIETLLSLEELGSVANGDTIEIRLDVKRISEAPPEEDRQTIEKAVEAFSQQIPDLTLGSYLDISLSKRVNAGTWQSVTDAGKTIAVVLDVPEELRMENTDYFILRSHEGGYTLLEDQDSDSNTVTILTQYFSTYAIAYRAAAQPPVIWPWILLAVAAVMILIVILSKRKMDKEAKASE